MSDGEARVGGEELQFDRVVSASAPSAPADKLSVVCAACRTPIDTEYYDVNGHTFCNRCRVAVESGAETPRGIVPFVTAAIFGLGAGLVGAAIYYGVIAIAHLEIGLVAILIGYMVGYAVRKGARGRGGLRFQVLAVALTYASVAIAYTPIAVQQMVDAQPNFVLLSGFIAALPVLFVLGSLPSGLISAVIIFVGMRQAWRMTGAPRLQILGPYRVGASSAPA